MINEAAITDRRNNGARTLSAMAHQTQRLSVSEEYREDFGYNEQL